MNVAQAIIGNAVRGVAVVDTPDDLAVIHRPDCAAAIWHRQPQRSFQAWLDALAPDQLPSGRMIVRADAAAEAVTQLCDIAQTPQCAARAQLIDDVAAMADIFADVMRSRYLRLRGSLWPEKPSAGLLHRSPPIEGTHETRLVLVLDPVSDPDDAR